MIKINVRSIKNGEVTSEIKKVSQVYVVDNNIGQTPKKIVSIWTYANDSLRQVFSLISSCFGSGIWMSSEKWVDTELWK